MVVGANICPAVVGSLIIDLVGFVISVGNLVDGLVRTTTTEYYY
jgi:hypothetical protein